MNVTKAVKSRRSIRSFTDKTPPADLIKGILSKAVRAPSGGNLQPWHIVVLGGEKLTSLKEHMETRVLKGPDEPEYAIYPKNLAEPYRSRRYNVGEAMYSSIGIERENKLARLQQLSQNFQFFGAPIGLFLHTPKFMGPPQWADLGMWLQTVMLLLREEGLDSCPQEAWAMYPDAVRKFVPIPDDHIMFCGMSIGYRDADAPINKFKAERAPVEENTTFIGL
ncbi:MAG: nitroreductase [Marinicaulis sp.]|nr:nitroreductase [Marinicaulis sp.]NNL87529.1 nitroreductase [Marinicaulis sp.]